MFIPLLSLASLALLVVSIPIDTATPTTAVAVSAEQPCITGAITGCNSVSVSNDAVGGNLLSLLGVVVSDVSALVGLS